jgi:hypothetical protein
MVEKKVSEKREWPPGRAPGREQECTGGWQQSLIITIVSLMITAAIVAKLSQHDVMK